MSLIERVARVRSATALLLLSSLVTACGSDSPTGPSNTPPPTVTLYTITGTVNSAAGGAITNGSVRVVDGPNAGQTSNLDGSGRFTLGNLTFAGFSIAVVAPGFVGTSRGATLTQGQTSTTINFTLLPEALWTHGGAGNTVFTMPGYFTRVQIVGVYTGFSSNFIVRIGGRLVVNELLGRGWTSTTYSGIHLTNGGGTVEITNSAGVQWSFTESR